MPECLSDTLLFLNAVVLSFAGVLLVSHAKSVLAMQNATNTIQQKMQKHKAEVS